MSMWDILNDNSGGGGSTDAPQYAKGSLGYNYQQALMADPTFSANYAAYKNPANWGYNTTSNGGESTSTDAFKSFQPPAGIDAGGAGGNAGLINIPGLGYVQPNYQDPNMTMQGGNLFSTPTGNVGDEGDATNAYKNIRFGANGDIAQTQQYDRPGNRNFGQTMLKDVAPLAAFLLTGGALAGAGMGAAGAGAAGGAEAGGGAAAGAGAAEGGAAAGGYGAGAGGTGFGFSGGADFAGATGNTGGIGFGFGGGAASTGAGAGGTGFGVGANGGIAGSGAAEGGASTGLGSMNYGSATDASGGYAPGTLGSGTNGIGLDSNVMNTGDISGYGSLAPSAGGVPTGTFGGGIGAGAGDGLGSTLGSGFQGTGVNSAVDTGTMQGSSGLQGMWNQAKDIYGQGKDIYNGPIGKGYRAASSLYDMYAANQKAKAAQGLQQGILDNYAPNSLYAQQMQKELAAKDAMSGRNSQYGARAQMLAMQLAQARANAMQGGAYQGLQSTAQTNKYGGLTSLSKMFGAANQSGLSDAAMTGLNKMFGGT